jgi:hypothetical protein
MIYRYKVRVVIYNYLNNINSRQNNIISKTDKSDNERLINWQQVCPKRKNKQRCVRNCFQSVWHNKKKILRNENSNHILFTTL